MEFALAFVIFGAPFGAPPQPHAVDSWFGKDKAKHFIVSALVQGAGHSVLRANGRDYREAAWTAAAVTMSVGVSKEIWDVRRGRSFSWKDLGADATGGGAGAILIKHWAP